MNYVPSSKPIPLKNRRLNSIIKAELFYEKGFFIVIPGNISLNNSDLKGFYEPLALKGTNLLQPVIRTDFGLIFRVKESENIKIKSKFVSLVNSKCMIIPFIS